MINKLYDNNNNYYIKIETFLHSWRGWNGNKTLPKYNEDSSEFCQFLLNKVTKKLYNLFKIKIDYKGQNPFDKNTTYHRTYFLRCVIRNDNVQDIVNQTIMSLPQIVRLPNIYFYVCRGMKDLELLKIILILTDLSQLTGKIMFSKVQRCSKVMKTKDIILQS